MSKHLQSLEDASSFPLSRLNGEQVTTGDIWKNRRIVLVFIRHFGCVCAKTQIHELYEVRDELASLDVPIVMVGSGNEKFAKAYVEDSPFGKHVGEDGSLPIEMYIDPSLKSYQALQMTRSVWAALKPGGLKKALSSGKKFNVSQTWGASQGDTWQLGGVFVVDNGTMTYAYRNQSTGDHADLSQVLQHLRGSGETPTSSAL